MVWWSVVCVVVGEGGRGSFVWGRPRKGGGGGEVMTTDRPLSTSCAPDCFVRDKSH